MKRTLAAILASSALLSSCEPGAWEEGQTYGRWHLLYDGYGEVTGTDDEVLMYPRSAADPAQTHASLVVTEEQFAGDVDFEVTVHTEAHMREGEPNPWEVGWVLWNYHSDTSFYALVLKPNGWELSKQDPAYPGNQRFLDSGTTPTYPIGTDYRVRATQVDNTITVSADGVELTTFTDKESPYIGGAIGLYNEDALVRFSDLLIHDTPTS